MSDLGFIAEEVEKVDPILVTYNEDGQVEGVKYKQLTAVVINAVKELKAENETLKLENVNLKNQLEKKTTQQQKQIDELRALIKKAMDSPRSAKKPVFWLNDQPIFDQHRGPNLKW